MAVRGLFRSIPAATTQVIAPKILSYLLFVLSFENPTRIHSNFFDFETKNSRFSRDKASFEGFNGGIDRRAKV